VVDKIHVGEGETLLIIVQGGRVIHHTWNMGLPHAEFVRRSCGELPSGAWVGTISKLDGEIAVISSKHFFGYQMPAPDKVREAVTAMFE
jgi:hypothetical protein